MKKDGFTLVELIASIAILAILIIIIIPNVINSYRRSTDEIMVTQENSALDAARLLLQDYYYRPISPSYREEINSLFVNLNGSDDSKKYMCLSVPISKGYLEEIKHNNNTCKGIIIFDKSSNGLYTEGKTYLYCDSYETEGGESYKSRCE